MKTIGITIAEFHCLIDKDARRIAKFPLAANRNRACVSEVKMDAIPSKGYLEQRIADKSGKRQILWNAVHFVILRHLGTHPRPAAAATEFSAPPRLRARTKSFVPLCLCGKKTLPSPWKDFAVAKSRAAKS